MIVKVKLKSGERIEINCHAYYFKGDDLHYLDEQSKHKVIKDVDKINPSFHIA